MLYRMQKFVKALLKFDKLLKVVTVCHRKCADDVRPGGVSGRRLPVHVAGPALARRGHVAPVGRTITLSGARSRLDQRRFSRPNTHFAAFLKI